MLIISIGSLEITKGRASLMCLRFPMANKEMKEKLLLNCKK